jgi:rhodanese-related sulfurtransferase
MEYKADHVEDAIHMPLDEIRQRMDELPKDREIWAYCFVGQRSYYAARSLSQYGFNVKNISGGFKSFLLHEAVKYLG